MTNFEEKIKNTVTKAINNSLSPEPEITNNEIIVNETRKDIDGDFSVILFPLAKKLKKSPQQIAEIIQPFLNSEDFIEETQVIKGFLNIKVSNKNWIKFLKQLQKSTITQFVQQPNPKQIVIEFSSPNTNKPQHLGHIRNNLLGDSLSKILKQIGHNVIKLNLINDRGIHICKSMLAWKKWGNGITPEKAGKKGDHLVGDFYVMFEQNYKKQVQELINQGIPKEEAEKKAPLLLEAQEMLRKWENGDPEVLEIWRTMNSWVLKGFEETYNELGIKFDKIYYESETYKLGKKIILEQLEKGVVQKANDGSVFIDLSDAGLDKKILLRSDGTSVYITQDIGNAVLRHNEYKFDLHYYVVADEQIYHFKVLRETLKRFGYEWWDKLIHFSYGMVELPEGKMKSREGKVVDADDLIAEMYQTAEKITKEQGKLEGLNEQEKQRIIKAIGLAALKFYILNVDPKRKVLFKPEESIDFQGKTGPFVQYSYARIQSIFRKAKEQNIDINYQILENEELKLDKKELDLLKNIYFYPKVVVNAANDMNPSLIANFVYDLAKDFNSFYHDFPILKAQSPVRDFRLLLSGQVGQVIKHALSLLGIESPERM